MVENDSTEICENFVKTHSKQFMYIVCLAITRCSVLTLMMMSTETDGVRDRHTYT